MALCPDDAAHHPEDDAIRIARDWNVKHSGVGFVTRFEVQSDFVSRYPVQQAGGRTILELWLPAQKWDAFNAHIAGRIEIVLADGCATLSESARSGAQTTQNSLPSGSCRTTA